MTIHGLYPSLPRPCPDQILPFFRARPRSPTPSLSPMQRAIFVTGFHPSTYPLVVACRASSDIRLPFVLRHRLNARFRAQFPLQPPLVYNLLLNFSFPFLFLKREGSRDWAHRMIFIDKDLSHLTVTSSFSFSSSREMSEIDRYILLNWA